ncbi:MAG TPA: response regulator [Niabella sp.]|nr:response regulator [Niabella sp.]
MKHIVLIEDDTGIREIFDILLQENYKVTNFENGNAIFAGLRVIPHLFIVDYRLPGYSGVELCKYIRNNTQLRNVPVLMTSATSDIAGAALAAGADEFINKPFSIDHIRDRVDFYTGRAVPVGEGLLWG